MLKTYILLMLAAHVLGDFFFQSKELAKGKNESLKYVLLHFMSYSGIVVLLSLLYYSWHTLLAFFILSVTHFAVDLLKYIIIREKYDSYTNKKKSAIFIIDQLVHIGSIIIISTILSVNSTNLDMIQPLQRFLKIYGISPIDAVKWFTMLLIIGRPVNITIKFLVHAYKPEEHHVTDSNLAGAFIGTLERLLILILLSVNQYAAIGLVLTAKSIARYQKITEDPSFSEYYLLGTLLSLIFVITGYILIF